MSADISKFRSILLLKGILQKKTNYPGKTYNDDITTCYQIMFILKRETNYSKYANVIRQIMLYSTPDNLADENLKAQITRILV